MATKRTFPIRPDVVENLRLSSGKSLETVANDAQIHVKTLKRLLGGSEAYLETIQSLAVALNTTTDALRADVEPGVQPRLTQFSLDLSLSGHFQDPSKLGVLVQITPQIIALLAANGIKLTDHKAALSVNEAAGEGLKRTIALIYGLLPNKKPFWAFVAVITNKYAFFLEDQKSGAIDMTNFKPYGEIIICGEGISPPDDIIAKVAQIYQTDYERFKENVRLDIETAVPIITTALATQELPPADQADVTDQP